MKLKFQTIAEKTAKSFRVCILATPCSPGGFNQFFTTIVFSLYWSDRCNYKFLKWYAMLLTLPT